MLLQNKNIAIIGAGPVGLTMARLLQQNGINVRVYERDEDEFTRISGGTLDLHKGSGQDALKKAGLLDIYFAKAIPMGRIVANEKGKVLFAKSVSIEEQYDNPEINRNDLRQLLINSLKPETVIWNRKFTSLDIVNNQWHLHFENGKMQTADFVICANGGMSKARNYVTDAQIEFTGTLILQGEINQPKVACPAFYNLCNDNILMTAANGTLLVSNSKNGGILSYNIIFKKPDRWDTNFKNTESIKSFLLERLAEWDESYRQLIHSTDCFIVWPTRKISLDKIWKSNRPLPITLIGDAAHIMPPFAGQGANIGMLDALTLSENLTSGKFDDLNKAINDYEQKMFIYAKDAQSETEKNEILMLKPDFSFQRFYE